MYSVCNDRYYIYYTPSHVTRYRTFVALPPAALSNTHTVRQEAPRPVALTHIRMQAPAHSARAHARTCARMLLCNCHCHKFQVTSCVGKTTGAKSVDKRVPSCNVSGPSTRADHVMRTVADCMTAREGQPLMLGHPFALYHWTWTKGGKRLDTQLIMANPASPNFLIDTLHGTGASQVVT